MSIIFGYMPDGRAVKMACLSDGPFSCEIIEYGASVRSLVVPGRGGKPLDVVLGFDDLAGYLGQHGEHIGAVPGRYANRIGGAAFSLAEEKARGSAACPEASESPRTRRFSLDANNGPNCLHGGFNGFGVRCWTLEDESENSATFSIFSPDGEGGFPGDLYAEVCYTLKRQPAKRTPAGDLLSESCQLLIEYRARSKGDTVVSLTNHSYFNLAGQEAGPKAALSQLLQLNSSAFTPVDADLIPTGEIRAAEGSPFDFSKPHTLGERINAEDEQLKLARGYDHNFVLRGSDDEFGELAKAFPGVPFAGSLYSPSGGVAMDVYTDSPGVQLYTANYLGLAPDGSIVPIKGKNGALYTPNCGVCLETQSFPDAPNKPDFPSALLKAGDTWESRTVFRFSCI
jgi:aldose 1-epimerase